MAMNTDALLRIKASVSGIDQVSALVAKFGAVEKAANSLAGRITPLSGALGALVPLASIGGLAALVTRSIDAADNMRDLSIRTGVSVEMLGKFDKAAAMSGTTLDTVGRALARLSKQMVSATSGFELGRKTESEIKMAVDAVRNGEREQTDLVRQNADARIQEVRDESDRRLSEINRRYRDEERLLNDAWDDQADAAQRAADERLEDETNAIRRQFEARREAIQNERDLQDDYRRYLLQQLEDEEDDALDIVRDAAAEETKIRRRAARDQQQEIIDALNDRKANEEAIVRRMADANQQLYRNAADQQIAEIKRVSEESIRSLKGDTGLDEISQQMADFGMNGKDAARAFSELGVSIRDDVGKLRDPGQVFLEVGDAIMSIEDPAMRTATAIRIFGRSGAELLPMMEMGSNAISKLKSNFSTEFAEAADGYNDKIATLGGRVGELSGRLTMELLPTLEKVIDALHGFSVLFEGLDPRLQSAIINIGLIAAAFGAFSLVLIPLAAGLNAVAGVFTFLGGLKLGAVVAGWLGALTPFLGWLGSTFVPAILAFFSGPVGWVTLAVIAVGAMAYAFREPIMGFLGWLGEQLALVPGFFMGLGEQLKAWMGGLIESMRLAIDPFIQGFLQGTNDLLVAIQTAWNSAPQFFSDIWGKITQAVTARINELRALGKGLADFFVSIPGRIATAFRTGFQAAVNSIKGVINTVLRGAGNAINSFIQSVNNMIASINRISAKVGISLSYIPTVAIPQFATGAFVTGPTIGRVGEDEDEYIIPANQMERATQNFQRGRRGAAVLNSNPGPSRGGPVNVNVNFSGQVIDLGNGRRAVTMEDVVGLLEVNNAAIMDAMGEAPMQLAVRGF